MQKNKALRAKDLFFILLALAVIIGVGYYNFGYRKFDADKHAIRLKMETVDDEIEIYKQRIATLEEKKAYVEAHRNDSIGSIELYNNLGHEIDEIDRIFEGVADMTITWSYPTLLNGIVRRKATIIFDNVGYADAVSRVQQLADNKYRTLLTDLKFSAEKKEVLNDVNTLRTSVTVIFYEKVADDTNLAGLTILDKKD